MLQLQVNYVTPLEGLLCYNVTSLYLHAGKNSEMSHYNYIYMQQKLNSPTLCGQCMTLCQITGAVGL